MADPKPKKTIIVSAEWFELIQLAKATGWGKMTVTLKGGEPTDVDALVPHIKLGTRQVDEELEAFRAIGAGE